MNVKETLTELLQTHTRADLLKIMNDILMESDHAKVVKDFKIENNGFHGSFTFGDDETLSWEFDESQKCCEKVSVTYDPDNINGKFLTNYDLVDFNGGNYARLTLLFEDGTCWNCEFSNNHNGYYTHGLTIYVNGCVKWDVDL